MKRVYLVLLISILFISLVACEAQGDLGGGYGDMIIYEVGDTINITASVRNDGESSIEYTRSNGCDTGINVEVIGEKGENL
jgi:hypothetical protein